MKKSILILFVAAQICLRLTGQTTDVSSKIRSEIPPALIKNADAIYRLDETRLDIISASEYVMKTKEVITLLNADAAYHLRQNHWFDKFNRISELEMRLYDAAGREVQVFRKKDFKVTDYYDGISLATDDKLLSLTAAAVSFPCTMVVECTRNTTGYIDLPDAIINNANASVEQFAFTVSVPKSLDIRYHPSNIAITPTVQELVTGKVYTWTANNIAAQKIPEHGYERSAYLPRVELAPTAFAYEGVKGSFTGWKEFGQWCYSLYEQEKAFDEKDQVFIKNMVKELPDQKSKVKVLYEYLKNNMRYVSIQFGIGGYKPFAPAFVQRNKYGDCKALTNYMRYILQTVGIKSYPALINAGSAKPAVDPEFPQNAFNHVILCVPFQSDTMWLECTSKTAEAGYLGNFTENKNALLLTEQGGLMVSTPKSQYLNNRLETIQHIFLSAQGAGEVDMKIKGNGDYSTIISALASAGSDHQKEILGNVCDLKIPDVSALDSTSTANTLNFRFGYDKLYDFNAGTKFFFPPSVLNVRTEKIDLTDNRTSELVFDDPYMKTDTTVFHLKGLYKPFNLPPVKELTSPYLSYVRNVKYNEATDELRVVTKFCVKGRIVPAAYYKSVCAMLAQIDEDRSQKLVLEKISP